MSKTNYITIKNYKLGKVSINEEKEFWFYHHKNILETISYKGLMRGLEQLPVLEKPIYDDDIDDDILYSLHRAIYKVSVEIKEYAKTLRENQNNNEVSKVSILEDIKYMLISQYTQFEKESKLSIKFFLGEIECTIQA